MSPFVVLHQAHTKKKIFAPKINDIHTISKYKLNSIH